MDRLMSDDTTLPEHYDVPPHDPRWELEPRWSAEDRARCDARKAMLNAPGLASAKTKRAEERKKAGSE
jgi:hypothetical protein